MLEFSYHDLLHGSQTAEAVMPRKQMFKVLASVYQLQKPITRGMVYAHETDTGAYTVDGTHFVGRFIHVDQLPLNTEEILADLAVMHANGEWAEDMPFAELFTPARPATAVN